MMNKQSRELLNFLKKQNQMLKDDITQLKEILKINKQALQVSINYKDESHFDKFIPQLINLLYQENNKLHNRIDKLKAQIQTGMCQALISDQIAFASTEQEVLLTSQLKDRLQKLRKQLQIRQNKVIQLSRINIDQKNQSNAPLSLVNGNLEFLKLIQYSDMNKVTKKLKDSIQKLNQELDLKKQEIQRIKDGKQELFKLNLILTKQLNELKILTSGQTTKSNNQISMEINNTEMSKYMKYQKKIVNQQQNMYEGQSQSSGHQSSSYAESSQSQIDQFPSEQQYNQNQKQEKVQKQQQKANQSMHSMTLKTSLKPLKQMNMTLNIGNLGLKKGSDIISKAQQKMPKMNIPKLQLTKAKQIQNLIVKKINNDQKKKKQATNQTVKQQKYKKLQDQIQNLRKKMGGQILQKMSFERECTFMKRIISELEQRNSMLVQRKVLEYEQESYEKKRKNNEKQNTQTLLDICRDVTLNQKLRNVVLGKQTLAKKFDIQSFEF